MLNLKKVCYTSKGIIYSHWVFLGGVWMTSISTEQNKILADLEKLVTIPDSQHYLGQPPIPRRLVYLLDLLLIACQVSEERRKVFLYSTACLHMALTTHERISNENPENLTDQRVRQLTILAGDYYSSLFYQLLATHGEVEGIHCLSQATSKINELKMNRYLSVVPSPLLEPIKLESFVILTAIADFFLVEEILGRDWLKLVLPFLSLDEAESGNLTKEEINEILERWLDDIHAWSGNPWLKQELLQWMEHERTDF